MFSTRSAVLRTALKSMLAGVLALGILMTVTGPAFAQKSGTTDKACANKLCTKDKPRTPSCWKQKSRAKISRCFIRRAAAHYHQNVAHAYYIAHRESRYNYRVTNPSSGTAGLYQFAHRTWQSTPYGKKSPYNPRWASLAAMWMWAHGGIHHWDL
jgi:soluble lytic murein transglycosylase-like protein